MAGGAKAKSAALAMTPLHIRYLTTEDALQLRNLRLFALKESPLAFTESYDELAQLKEADYIQRIRGSHNFGAFSGHELVGSMAYFIRPHYRQRHQGVLVGVYVTPQWRGQKVAAQLLDAVLAHAHTESGLEMMVLQVAVENFAARHTYLSAGFQSYGVEPAALKDGDRYVDEELMWLDLRKFNKKV